MTANSEPRNRRNRQDFYYLVPGRWATFVAQAVAAWITSVLTNAITAVVTILVLIGGLWLAYTYLPANVFTIILAVIIADITLGIIVRAVLSRRQ